MIKNSKYLVLLLTILSFKTFASGDKVKVAQINNSNLLSLVTPLVDIQNIIASYVKYQSKIERPGSNTSLSFSSNNSYLATAYYNSIEIYDINFNPPIKIISYQFSDYLSKDFVKDLVFSPNGKKIAFSTTNIDHDRRQYLFTINILDLNANYSKKILLIDSRDIIGFKFGQTKLEQPFSYSNDGKYFAFCGENTITLFDENEELEKKINDSSASNVKKIRFLSDNQYILINHNMGFSILDWKNNRCFLISDLPISMIGNTNIEISDFNPRNNHLAFSERYTNEIVTWDIKKSRLINKVNIKDKESIFEILFSKCGKYLVVLNGAGAVNLYDTSNYSLLENILKKSAVHVVFSPNGQYIACGTYEGVEIIQPDIALTGAIDEDNKTDKTKEVSNSALAQVDEKNNKSNERSSKAKEEIPKCVVCEAPNATVICKRCQKKLYCSLGCRTTDMHTHLENCSSR